jgi:hypothetical protein
VRSSASRRVPGGRYMRSGMNMIPNPQTFLGVPVTYLAWWAGEPRQLLVELKPHASSRNRHHSLAGNFCREGKRRGNVLRL